MFYVYAIKSCKDDKLYIGHTEDLKRRLIEHNSGKTRSTKPRRPFVLVYYEACNILEDAINRERSLKTGFGRRYLKSRLSDI